MSELSDALSLDTLAKVKVRFSAELGRTLLPISQVSSLAPGIVLTLDRDADAPIDLYVNGALFGTGRLVEGNGEWAVQIESLVRPVQPERE